MQARLLPQQGEEAADLLQHVEFYVMAGLVPGIHVFLSATFPDKTWMAGTFG
jgi:hypothetical protein